LELLPPHDAHSIVEKMAMATLGTVLCFGNLHASITRPSAASHSTGLPNRPSGGSRRRVCPSGAAADGAVVKIVIVRDDGLVPFNVTLPFDGSEQVLSWGALAQVTVTV